MKTTSGWLCVSLFAFSLCLAAQTETYRIGPASGSKLELIVTKTGFLSGKQHVFAFPQYTGDLQYDANAPENSKVVLRIDAASIQCLDDWVSESDRKKILNEATEKMLMAGTHKTLTFQGKNIRRQSDGTFIVEGDLSIRSMPKPVSVKVTMAPAGDGSIRFAGESSIDMTAWGLKPPKALLGAIGTKKEMLIRFEVEAIR